MILATHMREKRVRCEKQQNRKPDSRGLLPRLPHK